MYHHHKHDAEAQATPDTSMPWVARYIAAASVFCILAMAADIINGFRFKKMWFPCRFSSLSAAPLALLAVATKLAVDIDTNMIYSGADSLAQYVSLVFLVTNINNSMTSLGRMSNGGIRSNVTALVIFVITVAGNVIILMTKWRSLLGDFVVIPIMIPTTFMMVSLVTTISLAIAVPSIKRSLELRFREKVTLILREERGWVRTDVVGCDDLKKYMIKYLLMAESSSPQFVMGRSVVCTFTASTLFATIIYVYTLVIKFRPNNLQGNSPYGNYTAWIFIIQSIGVAVGSIAPTFRLYVAVSLKCSTRNYFKMDFRIEKYWSELLVEWRDNFLALQIPERMKCLHSLKWFLLSIFILIQNSIVLLSKLLLLLFAILMAPFFILIKKFVKDQESIDDDEETQTLKTYALQLEGEVELPKSIIKNVRHLAYQLIQRGRRMQPNNLLDLLQRSTTTFNGVGRFDSNLIPCLISDQEPPNCWTLPVATLTSIAVAIPNIDRHRANSLLHSVREGLCLAKIVEKTLVKDAEIDNSRMKAADLCWLGVVAYRRWLGINIRDDCIISSDQLVRMLSNSAREIVLEFKNNVQHPATLENPAGWPARVVAANSMYRISKTLLLSHLAGNELFEQLSEMVADILAACLTNLRHVITTKCHSNTIENREESVREAFLLLGKTTRIIELLQQREWPPLDHERAACIDEWRALPQQNV